MVKLEQEQNIFSLISQNLTDVLDRNIMKGQHLIMDNAPIHTPVKVRELVGAEITNACLPPYSSFLSRSEEF